MCYPACTPLRNMSIVPTSVLVCLLCTGALADDPVYFRSDRGIAPAGGALPGNLEDSSALRWRVTLDPGHSTPIASGDRVFLTTFRSTNQELATVALDRETGRLLWRQVVPAPRLEQYHRGSGSPAAATPACDGERVFVFFGSYGLICYDLEGRKLWDKAFEPFQDEYGASSSPVLVDDKIILSQDHDLGSFLMALDPKTGKILWKISRPAAVRSYSTPAVWTRDRRKELLVAGALQLDAYDPVSGDKLWWVQGLARIVIPVPVPAGEMIFMASWKTNSTISTTSTWTKLAS